MSSLSEERDPESGVVSRQDVADQATETTSLLNASQSPVSSSSNSSTAVFKIVLVLIIGSFTASADGSLVLATHPTIASEFNALSASNWLFVSFNLAGAATQAVVGKLSDIYGRRNLIVTAYALFAAGWYVVSFTYFHCVNTLQYYRGNRHFHGISYSWPSHLRCRWIRVNHTGYANYHRLGTFA